MKMVNLSIKVPVLSRMFSVVLRFIASYMTCEQLHVALQKKFLGPQQHIVLLAGTKGEQLAS